RADGSQAGISRGDHAIHLKGIEALAAAARHEDLELLPWIDGPTRPLRTRIGSPQDSRGDGAHAIEDVMDRLSSPGQLVVSPDLQVAENRVARLDVIDVVRLAVLQDQPGRILPPAVA